MVYKFCEYIEDQNSGLCYDGSVFGSGSVGVWCRVGSRDGLDGKVTPRKHTHCDMSPVLC